MRKPHGRNRAADSPWLVGVERRRTAGGDMAKRAGSSANSAHNHESGVAFGPALADVGACGFLAHSKESMLAREAARFVIGRRAWSLDSQPGRLASLRLVV